MQIKEAIVIGVVAFAGAMVVQHAQAQAFVRPDPFTIDKADFLNGNTTVHDYTPQPNYSVPTYTNPSAPQYTQQRVDPVLLQMLSNAMQRQDLDRAQALDAVRHSNETR